MTEATYFCGHCRKGIAEHHTRPEDHLFKETPEIVIPLLRLYCTSCGKNTFVDRPEK